MLKQSKRSLFFFPAILPPSSSPARCAAPVGPASWRGNTPTTTASSTTRWRETAAARPGRRARRPTPSPPCCRHKPATRPSLLGSILTRWGNIGWRNLWILRPFYADISMIFFCLETSEKIKKLCNKLIIHTFWLGGKEEEIPFCKCGVVFTFANCTSKATDLLFFNIGIENVLQTLKRPLQPVGRS